jgi:hypothetical protein
VRLTVTAALAVAAAVSGGGHPKPKPKPGPPPRVFAFVSRAGGAELARLEEVGRRLDVVAPNWYDLDPVAGTLRAPVRGDTDELVQASRRLGFQLWPVVNARTGGSAAWTPPAARARIVSALRAAALGSGVTGVTLDIEELRPAQRPAFTALVRAAAAQLHADGRRLAVYVPRPGPGEGASYDWAAIAAAADLLLASGYNEHWAGGRPGPVTTSAGFAAVTTRALRLAGARKAVPVIGAFGYRWPPGGRGELVSTADAERLPGRRTAGDGAARLRAGADTIDYETVSGLRARARAARAAGARWLGLFSLGREPARFWRGLRTARGSG